MGPLNFFGNPEKMAPLKNESSFTSGQGVPNESKWPKWVTLELCVEKKKKTSGSHRPCDFVEGKKATALSVQSKQLFNKCTRST